MRMNVLIKDPGRTPRGFNIENDLEVLQRIVGGYIEVVELGCGILAIVDEEGKLKRYKPNYLLPNGDWLVGTIIFCTSKGEDFDSLSEDQADMVLRWCR